MFPSLVGHNFYMILFTEESTTSPFLIPFLDTITMPYS